MIFKWRDSHMEPFLKTYRRHECLWNTKCSEYNKSSARENAYSSMLSDLNIPDLTVGDIRGKIKTIRSRYMAELTKVRNSERSGAGAGEIYEPRLFWFKDADAFLRDVVSPPKSSSSILMDLDSSSGRATNASENFEQEVQSTDVEDEATSPENSRNPPAASVPKNDGRSPNCQIKVRKRSLGSSVSGIHDAIKKLKQISDDNRQDQDEFDLFCDSLAVQLKKMPLYRALLCQAKLQSVMTQERIFQLTDLSMSSSSSAHHQPGPSNRSTRDYDQSGGGDEDESDLDAQEFDDFIKEETLQRFIRRKK